MDIGTIETTSLGFDDLIDISKSILMENDLNSLFSKLIRTILKYYMSERVSIISYKSDDNKNSFFIRAEGLKGMDEIKFINSAIEENKHNVLFNTLCYIVNGKEYIVLEKGALIFIPLLYKDKVLGIVYVENKNGLIKSDKSQYDMIKLLCMQAAVAIEKIQVEKCKMHRIERELVESEERYRRLFELSPDAICIHSEGKIVFANPAIERLYDVDNPKGIIGKNVIDFVHPHYRDIVNLRIKHIYEGGISTPFIEEKFVKKNGEVIEVEVATTSFLYNNKPAVQVVARDITDRKKMEKTLKENEALLRQITENTLDMILKVDVNGYIQYATPSHKDTLGYNIEEMIGRRVFHYVVEEEQEKVIKAFKSLFYGTIDNKINFKCKCADDSIVWVEVGGRMLYDSDKNVIGAILSSRDITKRMEAEKAVRDNEEKTRLLNQAVEEDKLRTEFFANLSHELRTPINVILGTLQLIELKLKDRVYSEKPTYQRYLKSMKQNCYRLIRLINNLIDVTKIDSGYFELHLNNCNIVSIVEEITLSVAEYVENKGISLLFDTDIEERIIACDGDKIERIMLNLISNSIKFTEQGGKILVNIFDKGEEIAISVKDTGVGIPKEKQQQLFQRFMQVDKSLARNKEGSGIGLSLVKSLVELHKGKIEINSEWEKGSEFIITLPVRVLSDEEIYIPSNYNHNGSIEKINIEFSDIYF